MLCCICGNPSEKIGVSGLRLTRVETKPGTKSGAPIPYTEPFPDGSVEKFVCTDCLQQTDLARVVGEYDRGSDIPSPDYEVSNVEGNMPSMPPAFPPWR